VQLTALQDSQHKSLRSVEHLDDQLADEQQRREQAEEQLKTVQATLSTIEKKHARELRIASGASRLKTTAAACQTERGHLNPEKALQTDWCAVHMPLPTLPHGGCILPKIP